MKISSLIVILLFLFMHSLFCQKNVYNVIDTLQSVKVIKSNKDINNSSYNADKNKIFGSKRVNTPLLFLLHQLGSKSIFVETSPIEKLDVQVKEMTLNVRNVNVSEAKELFEFSLVACDSNMNIKEDHALQNGSVLAKKKKLLFVFNQYLRFEKVYPYYFIKISSSKDINQLTYNNLLAFSNYYKDSKIFILSEDKSLVLLQFAEAIGIKEAVAGIFPNDEEIDFGTLNLRYSIKIREY